VDVFDLDRTLVADYASFARSFTQIRARDIRDQVDEIYTSRRFWPEPLITVNPHFEQGASVAALVADGSLHPDVARVFRVDGRYITLYRHQMQSVAKATAGQSFAVTTGTGSGKSLCFFIPIIDAAIRARASGEEPRTRAIVIYPMNALANSQRCEDTRRRVERLLREAIVHTERAAKAEHRVLVVGFAVHQGREIFAALADRMHQRSDLAVRLCLDVRRAHRPGEDACIADVASRANRRFLLITPSAEFRPRKQANARP
jgi:hypothetical protein